MGIKGNDIADTEAKRYAGSLPTISTSEEIHTLAYARRAARKMQDHEWVNEWKKRRQVAGIKKLPRVGAGTNIQSQSNAGNGIKERSSRLAYCGKIGAWSLCRLS